MTRSTANSWLHGFAVLTAFATFALIGIGGLVTSHEAGMAVPDWPTTYGYNMFLFPISMWTGGIFYEHTHRLFASFVGLLTTILSVWLWLKEPRAWVRWLGVIAFFTVVLQGVLGGLRVVLFKDQIGIVHAALAQLFLVLVSAIALFTSRWWQKTPGVWPLASTRLNLRSLFLAATLLIFLQLVLGATMRHQHAGLAVPDFPLAYGKIWPSMDVASVERINHNRVEVHDYSPVTAFQIGLHMAHRVGALLILVAVGCLAWAVRRPAGTEGSPLVRFSTFWFALIVVQALLGAATVWSNKAADMATAHVLVGAMSFVLGATLTILAYRYSLETKASSSTASAGQWPARSISQNEKGAIASSPALR